MSKATTDQAEWQQLIQRKQQLAAENAGGRNYPRKHSVIATTSQAQIYTDLGSSTWLRQRLDAIQAQMPPEVYNDPANHKVTGTQGRPANELNRDRYGRILPTANRATEATTNIGIALTDTQYKVYRTINGHTWLREELNRIIQQKTAATEQAQPLNITREWLQQQLAELDSKENLPAGSNKPAVQQRNAKART